MSIPYLEFKPFRNLYKDLCYQVFCDGVEVGAFYPPQGTDGKEFVRKMESLKMLVSDEVVDTFKYIDNISIRNRSSDREGGNNG